MRIRTLVVVLLLLVVALTGCARKRPDNAMPFVSPEPRENAVRISLYFADALAQGLVLERRDVLRKAESLEVIVLRELIKGPASAEGRRTIPAETKLVSVSVVDRIAYANFSREIVTRHPGGSTGESMTIKSIVYTLTELPGIERVQLLLEGEKKDAMFGHANTIDPIGRVALEPGVAGLSAPPPDDNTWTSVSPELAGDVTAVTAGRVTGALLDIVAYAGGELYVFSKHKADEPYSLTTRRPLESYVTSIITADLTGDGLDEVIVGGTTSGTANPTAPGFIGVLKWQGAELRMVTDLSRDTMFWAVAAVDMTGDGRAEVLASNGQAAFVWELRRDKLEPQHALTRFAGTISSARLENQDYLAWRDANGVTVGVFTWRNQEWQRVWTESGQGEWAHGTPTYGDLLGTGELVYGILDLSARMQLFNMNGQRIAVPSEWQAELEREPGSSPFIVQAAGRGYLVIGRGNRIVVKEWPR